MTALLPHDAALRADPLAQALLTLAKELWSLRDRQIVLETVLTEKGIDVATAVERYQPRGAIKARLDTERQQFLDSLVATLSRA